MANFFASRMVIPLFPTCQVRVVRFYVSLVLLLPFLRLLLRVLLSFSSPTAMMCAQCCVPDLNRECVRPVLRVGPQPRMCEASVARQTSTAMLCGQCCVPDLNRDHVRPVLRAGPQPRCCAASVACRTSTAIM